MGLLDFLFGTPRNRRTARQLASYLAAKAAEIAFEGPISQLIEKSNVELTSQTEHQVELLLFVAFPYDLLIVSEQGGHADKLQPAFREALVEVCKQMIRPEERHEIDCHTWLGKIDARFAEYAEILNTKHRQSTKLDLGLRACERVTGSRDQEVAMHLAFQFSAILTHLAEPIRGFEVVG